MSNICGGGNSRRFWLAGVVGGENEALFAGAARRHWGDYELSAVGRKMFEDDLGEVANRRWSVLLSGCS